MLSEAGDGWSVFFSNMPDGDGTADGHVIARQHEKPFVRTVFVSDGRSGNLDRIGSTQFEWIDYTTVVDDWGLHRHRSIAAHKESGWEWHEYGEPFQFEEFDRYEERRVKDRLTADMIERYCVQFGIELFNPSFYAGRSCIVDLAPNYMLANYDPARKYSDNYPNLTI